MLDYRHFIIEGSCSWEDNSFHIRCHSELPDNFDCAMSLSDELADLLDAVTSFYDPKVNKERSIVLEIKGLHWQIRNGSSKGCSLRALVRELKIPMLPPPSPTPTRSDRSRSRSCSRGHR